MRTIVIGAGISGLACALRLQQLGLPVMVLEQADRVGGVIDTVAREGFLFELGPQSFLATPPLLELARSLGLQDQLLQADPKAPRYVLLGGRLHAVPLAPPALLTTSLLGSASKLRLLLEPLGRSRPPQRDESVGDFVRRKFGRQVLDRLVGPMVSGVFAGDPEKLSLRGAFPEVHRWEAETGSLIRGALRDGRRREGSRPGLATFRRGNAALVRALAERLGGALRLEVTVEAVRRGKANGKSQFELRVAHHGRSDSLSAEALVVATPTLAAAGMLEPVSPRMTELLRGIEYAPVVVAGCGYRRADVSHALAGFGFLVPRTEGLRVLGTVWNSSLFSGRAPDGLCNLTSFLGGATDPQAAALPEEKVFEIFETENGRALGIAGRPVIRILRRYPRALPQYNLGHLEIVAGLHAEQARLPGLFVIGNFLAGPSIGACAEQAWRAAAEVQKFLASQGEEPRK